MLFSLPDFCQNSFFFKQCSWYGLNFMESSLFKLDLFLIILWVVGELLAFCENCWLFPMKLLLTRCEGPALSRAFSCVLTPGHYDIATMPVLVTESF